MLNSLVSVLPKNSLPCVRLRLTEDRTCSHRYLKAVVRPAAELHDAALLVEGEPLDVYLAGGLVDGRRLPDHLSVVAQSGLRHQRHLVVAVSTAGYREGHEVRFRGVGRYHGMVSKEHGEGRVSGG